MAAEPESCPIWSGAAWVFGPHLPAAMILAPDRAAEVDLSRWLLAPVDPSLASRIRPGDVVVAGDRVGQGSHDDTPVRALLTSGVAAVLAASFDAEFARRALALGLPAIEIHEALAIHTGARVRIDLEAARVVNLSSGDRYPIRNATEALLTRFRATA